MQKSRDSQRHTGKAPIGATRATAIISVGAVLLILGVVGLLGVAMTRASQEIRSAVGFTVIMSENAAPEDIRSMDHRLRSSEYAAQVVFSSSDQVKARWQELVGQEEPLDDLLDGANPFLPEFDVKVRLPYSDAESLQEIVTPLEALEQVEHVRVSTDLVNQINDTLRKGVVILGAIAAILLVISLVLINNTVRLTIYSRRTIIYTMRLVGATGGFIRRPIAGGFALAGLCSGIAASSILAGGLAWLISTGVPMARLLLPWSATWIVLASLPAAGVLICAPVAMCAVNRWLRRDEDAIYR